MLTFHIIAGSFLLLFGIGALSFSKGGPKHRFAGNGFFISLQLMAVSAMFLTDDPTMPILSIYYAATAWAVVLRKENSTGIFEIIAMIVIAVLSVRLFHFVITSSLPPTYQFIFYAHATIAALAALLDLNMILRGGLCGKHRMVRHAWRTCFALLGAVMSFSANTSDHWPEFINSNALIYLTIAVLFFWTLRVLFTKWYDKSVNSAGSNMLVEMLSKRYARTE